VIEFGWLQSYSSGDPWTPIMVIPSTCSVPVAHRGRPRRLRRIQRCTSSARTRELFIPSGTRRIDTNCNLSLVTNIKLGE
jgi:hypothetical protein